MTGDPWRAFLRDHHPLVRQQRLQSRAFLSGEDLGAIALRLGEKIPVAAGNAPPSLDDWTDTDLPAPLNLAARFPARLPQLVAADLDADLRPRDGVWTREKLAAARVLLALIFAMIRGVGGVESRHLWGRESLGRWGHLYLTVAVEGKEGLAALLNLTMKKPVVIGEFTLRIEVRCAPDNKTPLKKPFTLPGSVYPHPLDPEQYDLIAWQFSPDRLPDAFPKLPPTPLPNLRRGLWAALLAASVEGHWVEGARHETALLVCGVLARETLDDEPLLDIDAARQTLLALCRHTRDREEADRLKLLDNSLSRLESGATTTGYTKLAELIGDDAKAALLRLRGGGDPDAFDALLNQIAYAKLGCGQRDVYLDFSTGPHAAVMCEPPALIRHFHPHPHYPDYQPPKGKPIPLIQMAIKSPRLMRYESAINLPGIPFNTVMLRDRDDYRLATEEELLDPTLPRHVNIGPGFATPHVDEPADWAWIRWYGLWQRHLIPLTNNNAAAMVKLDQAIAWAVQHPLEKVPLGLCLTGDGGTGKSSTFNVVLKEVLGSVVGFTNVLGLEGQFRLDDLEGKLFYVVEEVNLGAAPVSLKELLKDLMKNPKFDINRKYGAKGTIDNRAIPIFLTNERNPNIVIAGQPERSLVLIQGATRENQSMTVEEWSTYRKKIGDNVAEFAEALKDPAVREAAMAYFMAVEVQRSDFNDNSMLGAVSDPRDELDPLDEALCTIIEADAMHSRQARGDYPLIKPFRSDMLLAGVLEQFSIKKLPPRRLSTRIVLNRLKTILGGPDSVKALHVKDKNNQTRDVYYITMRYGDMITTVRRTLGVELTPAYELSDQHRGSNEEPFPDARRAAWDTVLVNNNGY